MLCGRIGRVNVKMRRDASAGSRVAFDDERVEILMKVWHSPGANRRPDQRIEKGLSAVTC